MGMDAPFDVLGLAPDAGLNDLRRAWRRHVLATHPDRGGNRDDFERGERAYRVLCDLLTSNPPRRAAKSTDPYRRFLDGLRHASEFEAPVGPNASAASRSPRSATTPRGTHAFDAVFQAALARNPAA